MDSETTGPTLQPSMTERAMDTASDVSYTISEITTALSTALNRVGDTIEPARRPGMPLGTLSAVTREAPLASLFVAFLLGIAVARRR